MLKKQDMNHRGQVEIISLEQLVPKDHLMRKIDQVIPYARTDRNSYKLYYSNPRVC